MSALRRFRDRSLAAFFCATLSASLAPRASAAEGAVAQAKAGRGQWALSVGFDSNDELLAAACPKGPCSLSAAATKLAFPEELRPYRREAKLAVVGIGPERRAVVVSVDREPLAKTWTAVVAGPLNGRAPLVFFQGYTGFIEGEDGERSGPMVEVSETGGAYHSILIGEQAEHLTLCGRPTILAPKLLNPTDLRLHPAKVQRLTAKERNAASVLTAERLDEAEEARAAAGLLRTVATSSALGDPRVLTDGDSSTTWAENRGGSGRGEFALLQAPGAVKIAGFEFVVRPSDAVETSGASPKEFFIVAGRVLVKVVVPEDAWQLPGARYRVTLPEPVASDCLAVVLDTAYDESRSARVGLSEFSAFTELGKSDIPSLIEELKTAGERAEAAKAQLSALGASALPELIRAFERLGPSGQLSALEIADSADCELSVALYAAALTAADEALRGHAKARILRCGKHAAEALIEQLPAATKQQQIVLLDQLEQIAPESAVVQIVPRLAKVDADQRRKLRVILARASRSPEASDSIVEFLEDDALATVAKVDLLRALGERVREFNEPAARALGRLAGPNAAFRTRYLLLGPAAELASSSPAAAHFVSRSLTRDKSHYIRQEAARAMGDAARFRAELLGALSDPEVRVRQAAVEAVGRNKANFAAAEVVKLLESDPWPLVRGAAGHALGYLDTLASGGSSGIDSALSAALNDPSPHVRAPAAEALGRRRAMEYSEQLRDLLDDSDQTGKVREAAAVGLGLMCDLESVDLLTQYAVRITDPLLNRDLRRVAPAALRALVRIGPPDLAERLKPITLEGAPEFARGMLEAAGTQRGACQVPRARQE